MTVKTQITDFLMRAHAIDVSKYDDYFLSRSLQKRLAETQCGSLGEYLRFLKDDNKEIRILSDSMRINYSEFFRNPLTFAVLERIVLPSLGRDAEVRECGSESTQKYLHPQMHIARKRELRIWSAACAGGQEAYSVAILLEELKNMDNVKYNYRIFATDQNEAQVNEARKGEYSVSTMNNLTLKRVSQWFIKHGEDYTIKSELKSKVDFSVFDLFSEGLSSPPSSIFGDFNLIICANLLFYYKNEYRKIILEKIGACLAKGGFIVVGETEREILMNYGYHEVYPQSGVFEKCADVGTRVWA